MSTDPEGPALPVVAADPATSRTATDLWSDIRLRFLSELAKRLHQYGNTTTPLEATVESLSHKLGIDTQIWSSPTGILLSFRDAKHPEAPEQRVSEVLRLSPGETSLRRLVDTDEVADRVFHGKMSVAEGYVRLRDIAPDDVKFGATIAGFAFAAASIAAVLKARPTDIVAAALIGGVTGLLLIASKRYAILRPNKCNIVKFSSLFYWPNIIIALFALFKNKKIVWSPRGGLSKNALIYGSKFKQLYVRLVNLIPSKNIYFHATSEEEVNQISNNIFNKNEIIQLPNGILLSKYFGYELEYYFLFLGRIHPIKALDNLILALSKSEIFIKSKFKLKIAGRIDTSVTTKRYYNLLSELIKNNKLEHKIEWDGFVDQTKDVVLSKAFFLILPSHTENFGNVVIESMSPAPPQAARFSKETPGEGSGLRAPSRRLGRMGFLFGIGRRRKNVRLRQ